MSLTTFYGKIFGLGFAMGAGMEVLLIKSNYYQMLAASEAKAKLKEMKQEEEDMERLRKLSKESSPPTSSS
ncbi:uncharacterized protein BYT42DRAFT_555232 [Radiomyces spectabilis]|uniref:uncharacterized protein n=1 Tax=Radiomyces spectabilis TaxID=64574 RepID=UPI00221F444D|nr:uncharacterized protein BYT42DRAFT_555232 [Radiomyces spectabilis]KAI8391004.1 hypothetical protein BYT42DRAFT_555232 [Radiomyces spectabilis]